METEKTYTNSPGVLYPIIDNNVSQVLEVSGCGDTKYIPVKLTLFK